MFNQDSAVRRCPVHADQALGPERGAAPEPDPRFKAFFEAVDPTALQAAIAAIVATAPDPMDVERALHQGRSYPADTKKGWEALTHTGTDGKARPYHVYVPKGYDPARKHPAIVSLHGGVGRSNLLPDNMVNQIRTELEKDADTYGWIIIVPLVASDGELVRSGGNDQSSWLTLAAVKRRCNIDEDRVFLGGFSDGGSSGALVMGLSTPRGGPASLHCPVALSSPAWHPTTRSPATSGTAPVHAANGEVDPLYAFCPAER